jgi:hypothetical protein
MMNKAPAISTTQSRLMAMGIRHELPIRIQFSNRPAGLNSRGAFNTMCTKTNCGSNDLSNGQHQLPANMVSDMPFVNGL